MHGTGLPVPGGGGGCGGGGEHGDGLDGADGPVGRHDELRRRDGAHDLRLDREPHRYRVPGVPEMVGKSNDLSR